MAYWLGALTISALYVTAGLTCAVFTKEQKGENVTIMYLNYYHL